MTPFSASDAALEGFSLIRRRWRVVLGWAGFNLISLVMLVVLTVIFSLVASAVSGGDQRPVQIVASVVIFLGSVLLQAILAGARAVLLDQFSAAAALELIERERVTFIPTAPASIIAMLTEPGLASRDLSSLRVVITGGASCPVETIREYRAHHE